jgi:hypothetical protein
MNLKKFTIVPMLAMALFAVGCGPDCESQCEDLNECEGAEKRDCAKECEELEKQVEDKGCEDQYDDLLSCGDDQDDICKPAANACSSESEAFAKCMGG